MSTISYDPVKNRFAALIRNSPLLRRIFYALLDLFFLRSWHLRKILREKGRQLDRKGEWVLLDAGAGFGQYDRFLLKQFGNLKITAVDLKEDYLEDCRRYFRKEIQADRIEFQQLDLLELNERDQYDFVLCVDVLEHIEEDHRVLQNLTRSLKNGGYLLMHSPSHFSERDAGGGQESFVGEHARAGYSKKDISDKLCAAGLKPVKTHYTYGTWGHLSWILTVKYPMLLLNKVGMMGLLFLLFYYPVVLPLSLMMNLADLYAANEEGNGIWAMGQKEG